jgi:site-specific DNA recombinase
MAATATSEPAPAAVAALYCRISQDRAGDALGVDRQRQDCEALAERRGWTVGEVFVDDDRSAYSGRVRPGYNRMLEGLKAGRFGALVAWHPDRLHRSPLELESFIDLVNATGVAIATCSAGEYDLATAAGRMTARVVGAVARHESEQKSERIRRQREQAAQAGFSRVKACARSHETSTGAAFLRRRVASGRSSACERCWLGRASLDCACFVAKSLALVLGPRF